MEKTVNKFNKGKIFIGSSVHLVTDIYGSFIIGLIPILAIKLELSLFLVGLLTSINFIASSLAQPIFGYLSDKYGLRYFLIFGPLVSSIFISFMGILPNYWLILIFIFIGNLGGAAIHPPSLSLANYHGGNRKGFSNSIVSFGGSLGFSFGSLFIIIIVKNLGLRFAPIAAIPGIIMALIMIKLAPSSMPERKKAGTGIFKKFRKLKKARLALLSLILFASYSRDIALLSMTAFIPLYYTDRGVDFVNFGYIIMAHILLGGIGGLLAGYYSDRITNKTILIQAGILISVPLLFFTFRVPVNSSIVLFILAGFTAVSTITLSIRAAQDIFPKNISLVSSITLGGSTGLAAATVILIGKIADNIGIVRTFNYVLIFPLIASLMLFFFPVIKSKYKL